jgi:predicted O-methyltransferase YrrM
MKASTLANILAQAVRPSRFLVMARKAARRFESRGDAAKTLRWLEDNAVSFESIVPASRMPLWREACEVADAINRRAAAKLAALDVTLGGGAATPYLYYLAKLLRPGVIVETGVAAGYSSLAFLQAIRSNGTGRLYSSDFPYFRIADPEKYVGCLVDADLRRDWELYIDGDETNLPRILARVERIDLLHYDSDKSYRGREVALRLLRPKMAPDAFIVMDDIQDNAFFMDFVGRSGGHDWLVFRYEGKFVGLVGDPRLLRQGEGSP